MDLNLHTDAELSYGLKRSSPVTSGFYCGPLHKARSRFWSIHKVRSLLWSIHTVRSLSCRGTCNKKQNIKRHDHECFPLHSTDGWTLQGWRYFNQSLYFISTTKKTWKASRDFCLNRDADLLVINSKEEEVRPSVRPSVRPPACLSVCLPACLSVRLSVFVGG